MPPTPTPPDPRLTELVVLFEQKIRLAQTLGLTLTFTAARDAVIEMPYNADYDNSQGAVHGGVSMTLLDSAAWFAAAAAYADSVWIATSELTVHLLKPARESTLRAVGRVIQSGKRQAVAEASLYDAEGRLVAHGVGTFVVLPYLPVT